MATISPVFGGAPTVNVGADQMTVASSGNLRFVGGARMWQGGQHLQGRQPDAGWESGSPRGAR